MRASQYLGQPPAEHAISGKAGPLGWWPCSHKSLIADHWADKLLVDASLELSIAGAACTGLHFEYYPEGHRTADLPEEYSLAGFGEAVLHTAVLVEDTHVADPAEDTLAVAGPVRKQ